MASTSTGTVTTSMMSPETIFAANSGAMFKLQQGNVSGAITELLTIFSGIPQQATTSKTSSSSRTSMDVVNPQGDPEEDNAAGPDDQMQADDEELEPDELFDEEGDEEDDDEDDWEEDEEVRRVSEEIQLNVSLMTVPGHPAVRQAIRGQTTNNPFYVFDMAFMTLYPSYEGPRGKTLTSAFVLYNLGLCYHQRHIMMVHMQMEQQRMSGIKSSFNNYSEEDLLTALNYYFRALSLLEGACDDGRAEDVILLLLALVNNGGHVYCCLGRRPEARHCGQWMQDLVAIKPPDLFWSMGPDMSFFAATVSQLPEEFLTRAPAA